MLGAYLFIVVQATDNLLVVLHFQFTLYIIFNVFQFLAVFRIIIKTKFFFVVISC